MEKDNSRSVNILLCIAGVLCCIGSGFVAAPKGLLADESVNLVRTLQLLNLTAFFVLPSALMIIACILVIIGKMDMLSLATVLAGGALFAVMDFQFVVSNQTFSGILLNMIGVILTASAVALQVFATETGPARLTRKAAKSRNPKDFRYERSHRPAYDDIYMDASGMTPEAAGTMNPEGEDSDGYLALDTLKAEEAEAEAIEKAQKEQEDEIEALLTALSTDEDMIGASEFVENTDFEEDIEAELRAVTATEAEIKQDEVHPETEAELDSELDAESEAILAEMLADTDTQTTTDESVDKADDFELVIPDADTTSNAVMAHMAEALETPNKTMTDFYDGIEAIFLDSENQ